MTEEMLASCETCARVLFQPWERDVVLKLVEEVRRLSKCAVCGEPQEENVCGLCA